MSSSINISSNFKTAESGLKNQSSQGLILQGYCNSILQQPEVDFAGFPKLAQNQIDINNGLGVAKNHATHYLNNIQPLIIGNITNISDYFNLHKAIATALPEGESKDTWVAALKAIRDRAQQYAKDSNDVASKLRTFNTDLGTDSANFAKYVTAMNSVMSGDNGVLTSLNDDLSTIDGKIAGAIAGIVAGGLAVVGGAIMIGIGALASVVTGGAAAALVAGGVVVAVAGAGGIVAGALVLDGLYSAKSKMISQKSHLESEVKLVSGVSSAYNQLNNQAKASMDAATQMASAWESLGGDIDSVANNLESGIIDTSGLRKVFLTAANTSVQSVLTDVTTIKKQMTGTLVTSIPNNMSINQWIKANAS